MSKYSQGQQLITPVADTIPARCPVIVSADRGLSADWLYHLIEGVSWHPFLGIHHQGNYRLLERQTWQPLARVVEQTGQSWSGRVICWKTHPLPLSIDKLPI